VVSLLTAGEMVTILLCNAAVVQDSGDAFHSQLEAIFKPMLDVSTTFGQAVSDTVHTVGEFASRHESVQTRKAEM
jgi:hypothetical protein